MQCDVCRFICAVTLACSVVIGRRTVSWRICIPCELKERAS